MRRLLAVAVLLAVVLVGCGGAEDATAGTITVADAWARPAAMVGGNGAVYFVLRNTGDAADRLLSASSPVGMTEIHESIIQDDNTMTMRPAGVVDVPAGGEVAFEPGGLHVMLMGVQEVLEPGDSVPVTLTFEGAGEVVVNAEVREP